MAAYFFDSSALVKRYATETGTAWVKSLVAPTAGNRIYVARITEVETVAALARKQRGGRITPSEATTAIGALEDEMLNLFRVVEVTAATFGEAKVLARRYFLRGYDAMQLAAATEAHAERVAAGLMPFTLVASDRELLAAAVAEGLNTDDPENH